jgi:AraC-like DNA-binding protein
MESKKPPSEIKETVSLFKKVQKDELEEKKINDLIEKIEKYVLENKVYLDPKYSIQSLSADLEVPVYQLSPLINNYFEETYNAWINRYRIQHFISLCNEPLKKELTLEALAKESGFSNRTTFINSFKKVTGTTPSSYLKNE